MRGVHAVGAASDDPDAGQEQAGDIPQDAPWMGAVRLRGSPPAHRVRRDGTQHGHNPGRAGVPVRRPERLDIPREVDRHGGVVRQVVRSRPGRGRSARGGGVRMQDQDDNHRLHGRHGIRGGGGDRQPPERRGEDGADGGQVPPARQELPVHVPRREGGRVRGVGQHVQERAHVRRGMDGGHQGGGPSDACRRPAPGVREAVVLAPPDEGDEGEPRRDREGAGKKREARA